MDCVQSCVFGVEEKDKLLPFLKNGKTEDFLVGRFIKLVFRDMVLNQRKAFRMNFTFFDGKYVGIEKEV